MDDLSEDPMKSQGLELSTEHQESDVGHNDENRISTNLLSRPDIGALESTHLKGLRDSIGAIAGSPAMVAASDLATKMSAIAGSPAMVAASGLATKMSAIAGSPAMVAASGLATKMSAIAGSPAMVAASDLATKMSAIAGSPAMVAASGLATKMSAITGVGSSLSDQMRSLSDSMKIITGTGLLNGMSEWQTSIKASMRTIARIGTMSGLSELQKMMDVLPYHDVLNMNAKPWLTYARSVIDYSSYLPTHLESLTAVLHNYDAKISQQIEAFNEVPYLRAYQKRSLIAHETRQKAVRLGPRDLGYAETISGDISATQALVDQIAGVREMDEYPDSYSIEAEVFNALANEGPEYPVPLHGAIQAASSNNPDKARQTIASLRELTTHILHRLSPDADVKQWSSKPEHYHNGQPTRACRLEYIFRGCVGSTIRPFIENDVKFTKDFMDFLNTGTHSLRSRLNEYELRYAIYKTECLILLLLKYARE